MRAATKSKTKAIVTPPNVCRSPGCGKRLGSRERYCRPCQAAGRAEPLVRPCGGGCGKLARAGSHGGVCWGCRRKAARVKPAGFLVPCAGCPGRKRASAPGDLCTHCKAGRQQVQIPETHRGPRGELIERYAERAAKGLPLFPGRRPTCRDCT